MSQDLSESVKTRLQFPECLKSLLSALSDCQIRRRALVFLDESLLSIPGQNYEMGKDALVLPHPVSSATVVTIAIPAIDERWYYSEGSWGRL